MREPELDARLADDLGAVIAGGEAVLFTGAGFSHGAHDTRGTPLPDSGEMARELWALAFPGEPPDDSTLADLYEAALLRERAAVVDYLAVRLTVGPRPLPAHFHAWFAAPWRRIYTLNVDDLEVAAMRQLELPRPLHSRSALSAHAAPPPPPGALEVVHLNGMVGYDVEEVTFSPMQYGARLGCRQQAYERLAEDLEQRPFVFVGTTLDEAILWQHVVMQRDEGRRPPVPSYLVTRHLTRARQVLLESFGITWVPASAEAVGVRVLARAAAAPAPG